MSGRQPSARPTWVVVDVEADGPAPGLFSMASFAAVVAEPGFGRSFAAKVAPISERFVPEALAVGGFSRQEHLAFPEAGPVMADFAAWLDALGGRPVFFSDNLAFDWQWINYYFHRFLGRNPFGFSGRRIGDLYCGLVRDAGMNWRWKQLFRQAPHDHDPLNDALGNAQALQAFRDRLGLRG